MLSSPMPPTVQRYFHELPAITIKYSIVNTGNLHISINIILNHVCYFFAFQLHMHDKCINQLDIIKLSSNDYSFCYTLSYKNLKYKEQAVI